MGGVGPLGHSVVMSAAVVSSWMASCVVVVIDAAICLAFGCWHGSTAGSSRLGGRWALWSVMLDGAQSLGSFGGSGQLGSRVQNGAQRSVAAFIAGGIPNLSGGGSSFHAMSWIGHGEPSGRVERADSKTLHSQIVFSNDPTWLWQ